MPLPRPAKGEEEDGFISRCMGDGVMQSEFPDGEQRRAVCQKQWEGKEMQFTGFDDWIEIFMGGRQVDSEGREHDGDALIQKAIASFAPATYEPPIVVGHPEENAPAFGWVEGLKAAVRDGATVLMAKVKQVVPEFEAAVQRGLYKKRSAAFYPDGRLMHVGFLGAKAPAVKGLADLAFEHLGEAITFSMDDHINVNGKEGMMEKFKEFIEVLKFWEDHKKAAEPDGKQNPPAEGAQFSQADLEAATKKAAEEAAASEREKVTAEFAERTRKDADAARSQGIKDWIAKRIEAGKLLPAWKDAGLAAFMGSLDGEKAVAFNEGDEGQKTPLGWFQEFLDGFSQSPIFKEIATKAKAGNTQFSEAKAEEETGRRIAAKVQGQEEK